MTQQELIQEIHARQLNTFMPLKEFHTRKSIKILQTNSSGLYWIWTSISENELKNVDSNKQEVPIRELVEQRSGLKHISKEEKLGFKVVYNGIGGTGKSKSWSLRSRLNQEIIANGETVGTLNIKQRYSNNLDNWAISFFDFNNPKNSDISKIFQSKLTDSIKKPLFIKDLETIWRLEYGTPILCRH